MTNNSFSFSGQLTWWPTIQQTDNNKEKTNNINKNKDTERQENLEENWIEVKRKRQQTSPEIETRNLKQTKLNSYWLSQPVPTSNSFASLEEENQQEINATLNKKTFRLPLIFIDKVSNMQLLINLLNNHAKGRYEAKVLRNEQVKVQPKTSEVFTTIVKHLEIKNTILHVCYVPEECEHFFLLRF